ncbi:MAG: LysR substrate-binding domain-containing protein, partial [Cyanobacteria bacterium J06598_3]
TEAANELNLTQPAVSAKIKSLEANLGTTLFHRLGRKIELTAAGDYLLEVGPGLIDLEGRLIKGIEEIKQGKLNQLTLGCTPNVASGWLPKILFAYRQKYPQVDLQCFSFETVPEIYQAIAAGDIDVAFSEALSTGDSDADNKASFAEIEAVPVDKFQYTLVVAADHRLAAREWLSLRDLTEEVWALPGESTPNWMALAGRLSELGLQLSDFPNREIVEFPSLMSPFLSQGHYLGFASSFQFQTERKARLLTAISLQEFPLDFELFMLTSNSKKPCAHQPSSGSSQKPLQQLIQLIQERTGYGSHQQQNFSAKGKKTEVPAQGMPKLPVHWQMPTHGGTQNHRYSGAASKPGTLTIAIGTQNRTIQTVTAGLIIQRLGLLEHFLPRQGRYQNANYQIQWRDFTSGAPIVAGLHSDQLDLGILGDYPLLLSGLSSTETTSPSNAAESPNLKTQLAKTRLVSFVASNPDGTGNTVIVPNRSLMTSLDDFRDRVIAVPFASAAHGMIMRSLARADLLPEVTLTAIDNLSIHRLTPRNSLADGYAYFAPLHDIASHKGQFRRLLEGDPEQLLPTFHGVVVREAFADAHPELVIAYLKALIAAQYWYETTPSALSLVSNWVGLAPEIVAKTLAYQRSEGTGLFFPDTKIRTDWVAEHIQQLSTIAGNEALGNLNLDTWIQPG